MIIKIDFYQKIDRSEVIVICVFRHACREAILSAFDLLGDNETGGIFRDDYGLAIKDNPGQIILEVSSPTPFGLWSDDTDEYEKLFVWLQAGLSGKASCQRIARSQITIDERWHEVEE